MRSILFVITFLLQIIPDPHPSLPIILCVTLSTVNLWYSNILGCLTCFWCLVDLSGTTLLEKKDGCFQKLKSTIFSIAGDGTLCLSPLSKPGFGMAWAFTGLFLLLNLLWIHMFTCSPVNRIDGILVIHYCTLLFFSAPSSEMISVFGGGDVVYRFHKGLKILHIFFYFLNLAKL